MMKGQVVSSSVGIGPATLWQESPPVYRRRTLAAGEAERELDRLESAVRSARLELQQLKVDAARRLGADAAAIIDAQLLMLADPALVGEVAERVRKQAMGAHGLLVQVGTELASGLSALDDPYLRERAADVRDVTGRLLRHLSRRGGTAPVPRNAVLVAGELPPSELLRIPAGRLAGLILAGGGATSHAAILARSMQIPAVVGLGQAVHAIRPGAMLAVDGDAGVVVVNPTPAAVATYRHRMETARQRPSLPLVHDVPTETPEEARIVLAANIGGPGETRAARAAGAEGVGLFRTEYLFLDRTEPPGEEEQYWAYQAVLEDMAPHPVLIRTLDIGGDKPLPFLAIDREPNPALGWRGLRVCQGFPTLLNTQLRALLRAGVHGRLRVMAPMVTTRAEVEWLRAQLAAAQHDLKAAGAPCAERVELGLLVETPAAALMAEVLAPLVDFFSIGTNDLTQYTMAADRLNPRVAGLYDPLHPAVLRLIRLVVGGAGRHGRWVGVCGELAGDPLASPILVGLGVHQLSMSVPQLGGVRRALDLIELATARELAERALTLSDGAEVRTLLRSTVNHTGQRP